jgi:hypothetical protein
MPHTQFVAKIQQCKKLLQSVTQKPNPEKIQANSKY